MDKVDKSLGADAIHILPYSRIVGQEQLKLALELSYVAPHIGGALIVGQRGTAKSTAVRAFALMVYGDLPVTLPINATEDRVIGGWDIDALMRGQARPQPGLLEEADGRVLYIDEVNLLDDHIINLILDVTSTGVLSKQREGLAANKQVAFTLVGTMNPEEGSLRPQLLDRFGLLVGVSAEKDPEKRSQILRTVLEFDKALHAVRSKQNSEFLSQGMAKDRELRESLQRARDSLDAVVFSKDMAALCIALAAEFEVEGHRGDYVTASAARALAAIEGSKAVTAQHVRQVAPLALSHRRREFLASGQWFWSAKEEARLDKHVSR
jgi:magnesium chelatase subunit I